MSNTILYNITFKNKIQDSRFFKIHISNQLFLDQDWLTFSQLILNDFL